MPHYTIDLLTNFLGLTGASSLGVSSIYYGYISLKYGKRKAKKVLKTIKKIVFFGIVLLAIFWVVKSTPTP